MIAVLRWLMPITISSINGLGGDPPTQIAVHGYGQRLRRSLRDDELQRRRGQAGRHPSRRGVVDHVQQRRGLRMRRSGDGRRARSRGHERPGREVAGVSCDPPPPQCCDAVTVAVDTAPLPCVREGGKVVVQCSATVSPEGCADAFEWCVSDLATGVELQPLMAGGRTFSYSYPEAGRYQVTVRVTQDDRCEAHVLSDSVDLPTLAACPAVDACIGGDLVAGCRLDLPKNDVVESIDFERFFRLDLRFGDLQDVTTPAPPPADEGASGAGQPRRAGPSALSAVPPGLEAVRLLPRPAGDSSASGRRRSRRLRSLSGTASRGTWSPAPSSRAEETTDSSSTRRDTSDVAGMSAASRVRHQLQGQRRLHRRRREVQHRRRLQRPHRPQGGREVTMWPSSRRRPRPRGTWAHQPHTEGRRDLASPVRRCGRRGGYATPISATR